jgi:hypothetical protein
VQFDKEIELCFLNMAQRVELRWKFEVIERIIGGHVRKFVYVHVSAKPRAASFSAAHFNARL